MEMKAYKVGPRRTKCVSINQYNEIKEDYLKKKKKNHFYIKNTIKNMVWTNIYLMQYLKKSTPNIFIQKP